MSSSPSSSAQEQLVEAVLRAVKNGFIYGYRVRFLHSLAYQLASFHVNDNSNKGAGVNKHVETRSRSQLVLLLKKILKAVRMGVDHGKVLASFAVIYKLLLLILNKTSLFNSKMKHFVSGFIAGVSVYGGLINQNIKLLNDGMLSQITMYTLSRLAIAIGRDINRSFANRYNWDKSQQAKFSQQSWTLTCGVVWGGIMLYYANDSSTLLPRALQTSLEFIYGGVQHAWREVFDY